MFTTYQKHKLANETAWSQSVALDIMILWRFTRSNSCDAVVEFTRAALEIHAWKYLVSVCMIGFEFNVLSCSVASSTHLLCAADIGSTSAKFSYTASRRPLFLGISAVHSSLRVGAQAVKYLVVSNVGTTDVVATLCKTRTVPGGRRDATAPPMFKVLIEQDTPHSACMLTSVYRMPDRGEHMRACAIASHD